MKLKYQPVMHFTFDECLNNTKLDIWVALVEFRNLQTCGGGDEFDVIYREHDVTEELDRQRVEAKALADLAIEAGLRLIEYRIGYNVEI